MLSFENFLEKLNLKCDRLWQRPKASYLPEESCWYTNHSIPATGATILSHQRFNPAQIMSVSGHKSSFFSVSLPARRQFRKNKYGEGDW